MADIALVWNPSLGRADIAVANGDLTLEQGLETELIIRLFCDRLADPADAIPDGTNDRRGWWGDLPLPGDPDGVAQDLTGSKLWLLDRALQTPATLQLAQDYALQALAPMVTDGVIGSVKATASYPQLGWIELLIALEQQGSARTFAFAWQNS